MRAARFIDSGEPFDVTDVARPEVGPNDVLVRIEAASVCGSDLHYRLADDESEPEESPLTMGHEGAGVVAELGSEVSHVDVGDHAIVHYVDSCGHCDHCLQGNDNRCSNRVSIGHDRDGTFAEYILAPARSVLAVADHVPFDWCSIAACAVSTAFHATKRAEVDAGDTVAIFGIGGVGQHAVMWADFFGAAKIIAVDLVDAKLDTAREYGADVTVNPNDEDVLEVIDAETDGRGVESSIECSGSPVAMEQALEAVASDTNFSSGNAVSVGLQHEPFSTANYWGLRDGALKVSGDHTRHELRQIIDLMEAGKIDLDRSITHHMPLEDVNEALDLLEENQERVGRTVLEI